MNSIMRFSSLLMVSILLSGCFGSSPSVEGNWITTDNKCKSFCSFKIIKKTNTYSDFFVVFDEESMPEISSGPLVKTSEERFLIKSPGGDMLIRFKDGRFYFTNGAVYEKDEDNYLAYQNKLVELKKVKEINEQKKIDEKKARESAEKDRFGRPITKGDNLIPTPEDRWRYIKELERRQVGGGGEGDKSSLTEEQKQLLNQMQSDMKR